MLQPGQGPHAILAACALAHGTGPREARSPDRSSALQEIPEVAGIPSFWVNSAACVDSASNTITHRLAHGELRETRDWLPDGPVTIGVTSGASTPDRAVEVSCW